ncbi:MAG: hypothetical protein IT230_13875 [Flavobacteriales bacterium]|nr:hypothetical protein [Flavobacteriales bacterium]
MHEPAPLHFRPTLALVQRHWRLFAGVTALAIAISAVLSGPAFIKPRYRSQAVVYPVNLNSYSIETRADQLLQLLESNSIRDSVIARFNLADHYRIDTAASEGHAALYGMYRERVSINKTRYESVDLQVTDEDPVLARDMALEVLRQANLLARRLQRHSSAELLEVFRLGAANTRERMDSVETRLDTLRKAHGLLDYTAQTEEFSKGYARALAANAGQAKLAMEERLRGLEDHGGEFLRLTLLNELLVEEYGLLQEKERQALLDVNKELTYTNLVVYPEVADKKVYPVRWLIVATSVVAAVLLCYILVFLREQNRPKA